MFLRDTHLVQPEDKGQPQCTRGQMVRYQDEARGLLVEVFQYMRPDGRLGASGRADPKRLRLGDTIYRVDPRLLV